MSTALYLLLGWLLFNVLFAAGLYLRPTRKRPVDSDEALTLRLNVRPQISVVTVAFDDAKTERGFASLRKESKRPAFLSRVLLFGLWLFDRRHSV